jgi:protein disulfide-isomerase
LLDKEVFQSKQFIEYAKQNLVLVRVDFPVNKKQSEELKSANQALMEKYEVEGYPTIVVADSSGKLLGKHATYVPGSGPKPVIQFLEESKAKR